MKHKWHKEIKAWADGAEIEIKYLEGAGSKSGWMVMNDPDWDCYDVEYRIKPQPKKPQYLYVYQLGFEYRFSSNKASVMQFSAGFAMCNYRYIGKIKLEVDDV